VDPNHFGLAARPVCIGKRLGEPRYVCLTKAGGGTLILGANTNDFTGNVAINGGGLYVIHPGGEDQRWVWERDARLRGARPGAHHPHLSTLDRVDVERLAVVGVDHRDDVGLRRRIDIGNIDEQHP